MAPVNALKFPLPATTTTFQGTPMKKALCIFALLLPVSLFAQTAKERDMSNAEKFMAKAGTLQQIEWVEVGSIGNVEIKVLHITDLLSKTKSSALRFEKETSNTYSATKSATLDEDEVTGVIQSLESLKSLSTKSYPNYTEIKYTSRDGFSAGGYISKGKWTLFLKLERFDSESYEFLDVERLTELINKIWDGKKKLAF